MARYVELRRHTDSDGDALTEEGVRAALEIGRELAGGYGLLVSSGAQRATQTLACFACTLRDPVPGGVVIEAGLRSRVEDRWRAAYQHAGSGDLPALRSADPELVREDSTVLALRCAAWWNGSPREAGRLRSVIARRTRPLCWGSQARSSSRWPRAPAFS